MLAHTSSADEIVQGPLWSLASAVPFVGQNIAAVRDVTEATHILVRDALPPAFGVLTAVQADKIRFEGGGFNLEALRGTLAALPAIDEAFVAAQEKVEGIDRSDLLPIVDDAIGQVLDVIVDTAPLVHSATAVLPTALQMLGESEPRTYFVMFQNNAEIRATGGNPAAGVLLRVEGGRVSLVGQTGSAEFAEDGVGGQQVRRPSAGDPRAVLPGLPALLAELHQDTELPDDGRPVPGNPRSDQRAGGRRRHLAGPGRPRAHARGRGPCDGRRHRDQLGQRGQCAAERDVLALPRRTGARGRVLRGGLGGRSSTSSSPAAGIRSS